MKIIIAFLFGFALAVGLTSSQSCETATCRARVAHTGTYSAIGLGASVLLDRYNKDKPYGKLKTFVEATLIGVGIALIDEGMNGHGERFKNRKTQFDERALGAGLGALSYQLFTIEYHFKGF